jgi:hypothetical protein
MRDIMDANGEQFKRAKEVAKKTLLLVPRLLNAHHQLAPVRFG